MAIDDLRLTHLFVRAKLSSVIEFRKLGFFYDSAKAENIKMKYSKFYHIASSCPSLDHKFRTENFGVWFYELKFMWNQTEL